MSSYINIPDYLQPPIGNADIAAGAGGIYKGSGTVPSNTVATITDQLVFSNGKFGFNLSEKITSFSIKQLPDITNVGGTTNASINATIIGVGTSFLNQFGVGDKISLSSDPSTYAYINSIISNTQMTISPNLGDGTSQTINAKKAIFSAIDKNGVTKFIVSPDGYVGVNTSKPSRPFHVSGDASFDENVIVNGYITAISIVSSVNDLPVISFDPLSLLYTDGVTSALDWSTVGVVKIGDPLLAMNETLLTVDDTIQTISTFSNFVSIDAVDIVIGDVTNTGGKLTINSSAADTVDIQTGGLTAFTANNVGAVGINATTIDAAAQLQIDSTTKGFLPPRMTTTQKNAISSPATGLVVFDTTLGKLCVYSTTWQTITSI